MSGASAFGARFSGSGKRKPRGGVSPRLSTAFPKKAWLQLPAHAFRCGISHSLIEETGALASADALLLRQPRSRAGCHQHPTFCLAALSAKPPHAPFLGSCLSWLSPKRLKEEAPRGEQRGFLSYRGPASGGHGGLPCDLPTFLENGAGSTETEYHDHDSRRSGKDARTFDCVGDRRDDARLLSIDADAHCTWHVGGRSAGGG